VAAEKDLPNKHLISQNVANGSKKTEQPHPAVSIFNFHYASPPTAVAENYRLNKLIGDNETGFKGTKDDHYRMEAWEFILAGGGLYNNLDYSFTVGHEDGTFHYPDKQPGGGNRGFRRQMHVLKDFIHGFDFLRMKPARDVIGGLGKDERATVLAEEGRQYAAYLRIKEAKQITIKLPAGAYDADWINVMTGKTIDKRRFTHRNGDAKLNTPGETSEVALRIVRVN
jgi:hypothetical protein